MLSARLHGGALRGASLTNAAALRRSSMYVCMSNPWSADRRSIGSPKSDSDGPTSGASKSAVDFAVGFAVDFAVGFAVDFAVGFAVDFAVGFVVGLAVGFAVGLAVGFAVGFTVGLGMVTRARFAGSRGAGGIFSRACRASCAAITTAL